MRILIIIPFILFACTYEYDAGVDAHHLLRPYYEQFLNEAEKRGVRIAENYHLKIRFGDLKNEVGLCVFKGNSNLREVIIDYDFYKRSERHNIEWLMFHECGHCVLNLDHNNDTLNFMIQFEPRWHKWYYDEIREDLIIYLFNGNP